MSYILSNAIENALTPLNISSDDFSELIVRLLDYGMINRDESQIESTLYDRYIRCADIVEDYLSLMHVIIQHNQQFCFVRVYPPGSTVPGLQSHDVLPFNQGFRVKPSQQEVGVILVLRVEYEKALREGQVDEKGCVMLSLEGLVIALKNLLKRALPDNQNERKALFKRLKQLRLVHFNSESDLDIEETWLRIQPAITSFVSDDVLTQLYPEQSTSVKTTESL